MSSTTTPAVTPRREGEPAVDLTAYRLVLRAVLTDVAALSDVADRAAGASVAMPAARAGALHRYTVRLCEDLAAVQSAEERELWPVVAASAGAAVDLCDLIDDNHAVAPVLARCRSAAAALAVSPSDPMPAAALAGAATDLLGLLREHVGDQERELFTAIERFVSVGDFRAAMSRARHRLGSRRTGRLLARLSQHATVAEVERALAGAGAGSGSRLLLALSAPLFARERRAALG